MFTAAARRRTKFSTASTFSQNEADYLENINVKNRGSIISNASVLIDHMLEANDNAATQKLYRSQKSAEDDNERRKAASFWIIHPYSFFRSVWDVVVVLVLVFALLVQPLEMAFFYSHRIEFDEATKTNFSIIHVENENFWYIVNTCIDCTFLADVLVNLRTAYVDITTDQVIFDGKLVAMKYIKGWFFIDFVSSIPYETMLHGSKIAQDKSFYIGLRILRLTKLLGLVKFLRVFRLVRYIGILEEILKIEGHVIRIIHLAIFSFAYLHWDACMHALIPFLEEFPPNSWTVRLKLQDDTLTIWFKYSYTVYRSCGHLLHLGYESLQPPIPLLELWVGMITFLVGSVLFAITIAYLSRHLKSINLPGQKYDEKIMEVKAYMRFRKMPKKMQKKMITFYDHKYQRKYFDENAILYKSLIPHTLREEILLHICHALVVKVPIFENCPREFITDIVSQLQYQVFFTGDEFFQSGALGTSMYFIDRGTVEICDPNGQVLIELSDGDYFGEIALLLDQRRLATARAAETCDVYELKKKDFFEVVTNYPKIQKKLIKEAKRRVMECQKIDYALSKSNSQEAIKVVTTLELSGKAPRDVRKVSIPVNAKRPSVVSTYLQRLPEMKRVEEKENERSKEEKYAADKHEDVEVKDSDSESEVEEENNKKKEKVEKHVAFVNVVESDKIISDNSALAEVTAVNTEWIANTLGFANTEGIADGHLVNLPDGENSNVSSENSEFSLVKSASGSIKSTLL